MSDLYVMCSTCGRLTKGGRLPKGGDGTFYYPRRHRNAVTGAPCEGNIKEGILQNRHELRPKMVHAIIRFSGDSNLEVVSVPSAEEVSKHQKSMGFSVLWLSSEIAECELLIEADRVISSKLGLTRWRDIRKVLSFKGNFISGYQVYLTAWSEPAQGKYFTSPCDIDSAMQFLIDEKVIAPTKFNPDPKRAPAIGLIGYNSGYVATLKSSSNPVAGHYVDWVYEVTAPILNPWV